jgi:hypothetical protein
MGVGVVASAAVDAAAEPSAACCHRTLVTPPDPTCAAVTNTTDRLLSPEDLPIIRGSSQTTRPSLAPTASAFPSPRHATDVAPAPTAIEPRACRFEPAGASASISTRRPSAHAAANTFGAAGENLASFTAEGAASVDSVDSVDASLRTPVSQTRTAPSADALASICRRCGE